MSAGASESFPRLLGDVGGTNARFALQLAPGERPVHQRTLPGADYPGLKEAIQHYLAETATPRPRWGAIGIANPITGDWVSMTNREWSFSIQALKRDLALGRLLVLNDFTALALALPTLSADEVTPIGDGAARARAPIGLLGPGTGLGMSGLVPCGDDYVPIEGEGGHVTLAAHDEREAAIIASIRNSFEHVSAERVLTGPGMVNLYRACAELQGVPVESLDPAEISARGLAGTDPVCAEVLEVFCCMLGTVAANLALVLGAHGGVYLGGGIVPKLGDYFARSGFRARFEEKGRFSGYLARIPTYVIRARYPALTGAARALELPPHVWATGE